MNDLLSGRARELRKAMTDAERRLWGRLRNEQLGARFRRQAPIGPYIVDFVCFAQRLVIECDGGQHAEAVNMAQDRERTSFLEGAGFRVLRFWNNEVLANVEGVMERIVEALAQGGQLSSCTPHPNPPPQRGEGVDSGGEVLAGSNLPSPLAGGGGGVS